MAILEEKRTYEPQQKGPNGRVGVQPVVAEVRREEVPPEPPHEKEAIRTVISGSTAEGFAGGAGVILAILGLAGVYPGVLLPIATIAIGASLLFQGAAVALRFSALLADMPGGPTERIEFGGGMTSEFIAGICGIVLGILSLLGVAPVILTSIAALVFGGGLLFGSGLTSRLNALEIFRRTEHEGYRQAYREAVWAASGLQLLVGLGLVTLGILALVGPFPMTLSLVAMLGIGAATMLSGTAICGRMMSCIRR